MKKYLFLSYFIFEITLLFGGGAPSTYFNLYLPPNNEAVQRNVALIITAIHDSTSFTILDDNLDGDDDDSVSGILMAGQSYILYIKDNGINDDAANASGGTLKRDGDYFIVNSDKLVYASMSTDSDWQHDFVCSVNKKSVGVKFIVYAPKISSSLRDLNVFAYEDNTTITISKISQSATTQSGYTNVDVNQKTIVAQRTINRGEDIIYYFQDGRNIMNTGETYMIESNKDASVQYGALHQNARDGGAYVPSSNGSSSGELFYFAVPYQASGEQEIRIISWDDNNNVLLERYDNGNWINMQNWNLDELNPADWVGKQNGNSTYPTVFRIACSPEKKVSVFEANWMETGSTSTSDMATMVSSANGTASGKEFLVYMLPPSKQTNVVDPFTGELFGSSISHLYLFAGNTNTTVTIKDAKTNGQVLSKTYPIDAGRYVDAYFSIEEWMSIYNGTGTASGPDRPYVLIESTENISVVTANPNDNWMMYFGSSLPQSFTIEGTSSQGNAIPGDTIISYSNISIAGSSPIENTSASVIVSSGGIPVASVFINETTNDSILGDIVYNENQSIITYDNLPELNTNDAYVFENKTIISAAYNDGQPISEGTVIIIETILTGEVDGEMQQTILAQGIGNNSSNTSNLFFSNCGDGNMVTSSTDSWNGAGVDYNSDGWEDIFITEKDEEAKNQLFKNNGDGSYTQINSGPLVNNKAKTVSSTWADINNDGHLDVFIVNATGQRSMLYLNDGNGNFSELNNSGIDSNPEYFHGAAFADFDNDSYIDLIITNFFPTRFHQLYKNNGNNTFTLLTNTPVTAESERAVAPILTDYNNDGFVDIFIPNGDNRPNSLFKNLGGFQFEKITTGEIVTNSKNSVGAAWGDINNDGYLDLIVTNSSGQNNDLYQNNGDDTFTKMEESIISQEGGHSHGVSMIDVDNDGDLDISISNDEGPNFLYTNDGTGNFSRKLDEVMASDFGNSFGQVWADFNKNGALDAMIFTQGGDNNQRFCNNGNTNNWINIRLIGRNSNKSAIGTRVKVKCNGLWQKREILPVSGFGSQQSIRAHFGLGDATVIDEIVIKWPSGYTQTITSGVNVNTFIAVIEEEANLLYGITFNDLNGNGQRESDEELIGNIKMETSSSNQYLSSNSNGSFQIRLADGIYALDPVELMHWSTAESLDFTIDSGTDSVYLEVPLQAVQFGHDLKIDFATTAWRRGFTNNTVIQISNSGTENAISPTITMTYPAEGYVLSSDLDFAEVSSKVYEWVLDELKAGEVASINVVDSISLNASGGQVLTLSGTINANGTELNSNNNEYTEGIEIVGAIDPNDIQVFPKGAGSEGYISKEQNLTYHIRFQNVGTYYATNAVVENQLPEYLDHNSFEVISSSHDYNYSITNGLLRIKYDNIYLLDSITNEPESHGHFRYKIKPKKALFGGESISNAADVIFDFEEAIKTNVVVNTIKFQNRESYTLVIYPNPASGNTTISLDLEHFKIDTPPKIESYEILDLSGQVLTVVKNIEEETKLVPLDKINPGLYIIRAVNNKGDRYVGKLIVRKNGG